MNDVWIIPSLQFDQIFYIPVQTPGEPELKSQCPFAQMLPDTQPNAQTPKLQYAPAEHCE